MTTYLVTFEGNRIGRDHGVRPRTFTAPDWGGLVQAVHQYARRHLLSRFPEVIIDHPREDAEPSGLIFAGAHTVARFTIEEIDSNTVSELIPRGSYS